MTFRLLAFLVLCGTMTLTSPSATAQDNPIVLIETSLGNITAELDQANAPVSVANFLQYAEDNHYAGTVFHRVIKDFMIQGGGFTADMQQKSTRSPIENEATNGLTNDRYTLAQPPSSSSTPEPPTNFSIIVERHLRSMDTPYSAE